tara:strand:+ start:587 stop:730 length:144 start_codon:yes stop_codon:yes gene_type:complete
MTHFYKYSLHEIEFMAPWERNIYVTMIRGFLEEEDSIQKQREMNENI